jgi:hypothetical protein
VRIACAEDRSPRGLEEFHRSDAPGLSIGGGAYERGSQHRRHPFDGGLKAGKPLILVLNAPMFFCVF